MEDDISISKGIIEQLVEGTIDDDNVDRLLKLPKKDSDRFFTYIEVLQDRVSWNDPILLRLSDKLYIVSKGHGKRVPNANAASSLVITERIGNLPVKFEPEKLLKR